MKPIENKKVLLHEKNHTHDVSYVVFHLGFNIHVFNFYLAILPVFTFKDTFKNLFNLSRPSRF